MIEKIVRWTSKSMPNLGADEMLLYGKPDNKFYLAPVSKINISCYLDLQNIYIKSLQIISLFGYELIFDCRNIYYDNGKLFLTINDNGANWYFDKNTKNKFASEIIDDLIKSNVSLKIYSLQENEFRFYRLPSRTTEESIKRLNNLNKVKYV